MPRPLYSHTLNLRKDLPGPGSITTGMLADGAVTWPKTALQSYARVARSGAAQSIPNTTNTAVIFDAISTTAGGLFSLGTPDRFTIQQDGIYLFGGSVQIADSAGGTFRELFLTLTGGVVAMTSRFPGIFTTLAIATMGFGAAGNVIQLFVGQDSGGALTLPATNVQPNMWIARVA